MIKLGNQEITLKVGSADVSAAYIGSVLVYNPVPPEPKWIATYTGGTTSSAECDASSAITTNEITKANLQSVEIHSCVTSIGNSVFSYCSGLTSVTIPDSVTSIGDYSFKYCSGLTSVNIPSGVTSIGTQAFYECTNAQITSLPNYITTIGSSAFSYCDSMTTVNIPSGVTTINDWAFRGNYLTSVTIPSGVTSIGTQAFAMCTKLESVTCYATTPPTLATGAFNNNKSGRIIYVPAASVTTYQSASGWSAYASRIQAIP